MFQLKLVMDGLRGILLTTADALVRLVIKCSAGGVPIFFDLSNGFTNTSPEVCANDALAGADDLVLVVGHLLVVGVHGYGDFDVGGSLEVPSGRGGSSDVPCGRGVVTAAGTTHQAEAEHYEPDSWHVALSLQSKPRIE